jgi:hypothetical protein
MRFFFVGSEINKKKNSFWCELRGFFRELISQKRRFVWNLVRKWKNVQKKHSFLLCYHEKKNCNTYSEKSAHIPVCLIETWKLNTVIFMGNMNAKEGDRQKTLNHKKYHVG